MTDTASAFEATFSDFKIVKGRKVAQVVLEVPLESADRALNVLGGVPRPDAECWVGVARIQSPQRRQAPPQQNGRKQPSVRAALLCRQVDFQMWVGEKSGQLGQTEESAAHWLRKSCGVFSRSTFDTDADARARFELLENQFLADTGRSASPERR
jgi:hypothetical protein